MARSSAATVQKPGARSSAATDEPEVPAEPQGAAAAAIARRADGPVDPTTIKQPVFTDEGWLCPEKPEPQSQA